MGASWRPGGGDYTKALNIRRQRLLGAILEAMRHTMLFHLCEFRERAKFEKNSNIDYSQERGY